jgi:hypothetical protein
MPSNQKLRMTLAVVGIAMAIGAVADSPWRSVSGTCSGRSTTAQLRWPGTDLANTRRKSSSGSSCSPQERPRPALQFVYWMS